MPPDVGMPCLLCRLQSRPTVLFGAALAVFVLLLVTSLLGLLL